MAVAQHLPQGRHQAGDRHFKFHEDRDNLLAADDALVTVPAAFGWLFARTLVATFAERMAASELVRGLVERADGGPTAPSLTAGIAFSQVKSPIESAIRAADSAMKNAKRSLPGQAAIGWTDLTHPASARPVTASWLDENAELIDTVTALPGSSRNGWEQDLLAARQSRAGDAPVSDARLRAFMDQEFDRLGQDRLRNAQLTPDDLLILVNLARWWPPPSDHALTGGGVLE